MATRRQPFTSNSESDSSSSSDGYVSSTAPARPRKIRFRVAEPPRYKIDLSLPPEIRYRTICEDYKETLAELVGIYDDILAITIAPRFFAFVAKRILRRVHSTEETKEIKGISKITGIPIHLIVAYNTFLDIFSGCMSGGAQLRVPETRDTTMVHFRNLDWGMDLLRKLIIKVDYVREGEVIARGVTYAGYLGVLTGVRQGLSISLNYRKRIHSKSSAFHNGLHYLSILLGYQSSIASELRNILLSPGAAPTLDDIRDKFSKTKSSSCYLTFCTPSEVLVVEKDLRSSVSHSSDQFLAVTNHDVAMENWTEDHWKKYVREDGGVEDELGGIKGILEDSIERKECMMTQWRNKGTRKATLEDLKRWLQTYPIRNECTHYSCIMDPSVEGGGIWVETCEEK